MRARSPKAQSTANETNDVSKNENLPETQMKARKSFTAFDRKQAAVRWKLGVEKCFETIFFERVSCGLRHVFIGISDDGICEEVYLRSLSTELTIEFDIKFILERLIIRKVLNAFDITYFKRWMNVKKIFP